MIDIMYFIGKIFYFLKVKWEKSIHHYLQRYYYHRIKYIGEGVRFNGISKISGFDQIKIGNNVHIGNNAHIVGDGGLLIGDNTHISRNMVLYTVNHNYQGQCLPYDSTEVSKQVIIEKNVWIGMNVTILPGSHIEEGCIIGAGSVVSGRVPKLVIYGAALGKVIANRDEEHYNRLESQNQYGGINGEKIHQDF